jgi:hypothetical protein
MRKEWDTIARKSRTDWLVICSFFRFPNYKRMGLQAKGQVLVEVYICDKDNEYRLIRRPIFSGFPFFKEFVQTAGGDVLALNANPGEMMQGLMERISKELARMFYEHKRRPVYRRATDVYGR